MTQTVRLTIGDQPVNFNFGTSAGVPVYTLATATGASLPVYKSGVYSTVQAIATAAATVAVQGSNDDNTGRGFTAVGKTAAGFPINTTNASTAVTSPGGDFTAAMGGALVDCVGVPPGTTFTFVSATAGTLSANATATQLGVGAIFRAVNWAATALGTITLAAAGNDGVSIINSWRYLRLLVSGNAGVVNGILGN